MSKDSDDEELLAEAKDGGKAVCKRADMLEQLATWGITSAVIKKVSKTDTKTDMPKVLLLRAFYNVAVETQYDYASRPWSEIRVHFSKMYSYGLPEAEPTDRAEIIQNWAARCWTAAWSPGSTAGEDEPEKGEKGQPDKTVTGDVTLAQKKMAEDRAAIVQARARELREMQEKINAARAAEKVQRAAEEQRAREHAENEEYHATKRRMQGELEGFTSAKVPRHGEPPGDRQRRDKESERRNGDGTQRNFDRSEAERDEFLRREGMERMEAIRLEEVARREEQQRASERTRHERHTPANWERQERRGDRGRDDRDVFPPAFSSSDGRRAGEFDDSRVPREAERGGFKGIGNSPPENLESEAMRESRNQDTMVRVVRSLSIQECLALYGHARFISAMTSRCGVDANGKGNDLEEAMKRENGIGMLQTPASEISRLISDLLPAKLLDMIRTNPRFNWPLALFTRYNLEKCGTSEGFMVKLQIANGVVNTKSTVPKLLDQWDTVLDLLEPFRRYTAIVQVFDSIYGQALQGLVGVVTRQLMYYKTAIVPPHEVNRLRLYVEIVRNRFGGERMNASQMFRFFSYDAALGDEARHAMEDLGRAPVTDDTTKVVTPNKVIDPSLADKADKDKHKICHEFNSTRGCKFGKKCRYINNHKCKLCGVTTHGASECPSKPKA